MFNPYPNKIHLCLLACVLVLGELRGQQGKRREAEPIMLSEFSNISIRRTVASGEIRTEGKTQDGGDQLHGISCVSVAKRILSSKRKERETIYLGYICIV